MKGNLTIHIMISEHHFSTKMWSWIPFQFRSTKFLELMDSAEKAIEQVNADQIYTSKQFMRIRDNFQVN